MEFSISDLTPESQTGQCKKQLYWISGMLIEWGVKHVVGSFLSGSPGGIGGRELSTVVKIYPDSRLCDISRPVLKNVLPPQALRQHIKLCPADWLLFGLPAIRQCSNSLATEVYLRIIVKTLYLMNKVKKVLGIIRVKSRLWTQKFSWLYANILLLEGSCYTAWWMEDWTRASQLDIVWYAVWGLEEGAHFYKILAQIA